MADIDYEAQRLENLAHKQKLLADLNLNSSTIARQLRRDPESQIPTKKKRIQLPRAPSQRTSARLANSNIPRPNYNEDERQQNSRRYNIVEKQTKQARNQSRTTSSTKQEGEDTSRLLALPTPDASDLIAGWSNWTATASAPTRDLETQNFHFETHPDFLPNKSPPEVLREGAFGGTYFAPYRSKRLGITVADDWQELPRSWIEGLNISRYLTSPVYNSESNKFGVAAGQDIAAWEESGWIAHEFDIRGWFQWYCRFFQGRRCEDDDRQVARWRKCVGETGRWRRALLKKYAVMGVREVWDDEGDESREVSPVMHQTCHHWAWEVRQEVLDEFWRSGGR